MKTLFLAFAVLMALLNAASTTARAASLRTVNPDRSVACDPVMSARAHTSTVLL